MTSQIKTTSLNALHRDLVGKMVEFAGYDMPVQYADGVLKEHNWTRENAGLFDVSHMGQAFLKTTEKPLGEDGAHEAVAAAIETLVPGEIKKIKKGGLRYSVLLNENGGIVDDLMITRPARDDLQGMLFLVVNAACKAGDFALIAEKLGDRATLEIADDRSLIALQGPKAAGVLSAVLPGVEEQTFMTMNPYGWSGVELFVSRCGYTGEDGFEISIPDGRAEDFARLLLNHDEVKPIGLGARDSLRLEAGLCLYGHDIDAKTSPVEGNIAFVIGKRRRAEGGFPGADRILQELAEGPARLRVGIRPEGRAPAREGVEIQSGNGEKIGEITSGGFGPTAGGPVAMGYVDAAHGVSGTEVHLLLRGKPAPATIVDMPVVAHNYYRGD